MKPKVMDSDNPFLPEEIMTNILKCLPVKSLIRFRCVCKHWKNLIKSPSFIEEHLQHSSNENPLLLLQWDAKCDNQRLRMIDCEMRVLEVHPPPLILREMSEIVGCSNGLLCVKIFDYCGASLPSLLLWNPATIKVRKVPRTIYNLDDGDFYVGFRFSPIVNDYKIVISREKELDQEDNRVEVYSLSTGLWREVKVEDFGGVRLHSHPVTANGSIFWPGDDSEDDWMIIAFDITMEVFSLLPPPASLYFGSRPCLTAYENKLATVIENHELCAIDFWLMDERTSASGQRCSWSKKYTISTCLSWYPRCIWMDQIVCDVTDLYKSESEESECEANNGRHTVLSLLNLRTHVLEKNFIHRYRVSGIFKYAESLVSVGNYHV